MSRETLSGWGRTSPAVVDVVQPQSENDVLALLQGQRPVVARGLGRSYGDAAQVSGGVVVDNRGLLGISSVEPDGRVRVGAGVSIDELLAEVMPRGWFVPVTPGTRQVTMAGAVAADVHGKGHHRDGTFGAHVSEIRLATPSGLRVLTRENDPELFWATVGGMGLTGIISEITVQLTPIQTNRALVDTERHTSLRSVMDTMMRTDDNYHFSVAWVDCMTRGKNMGRAILERGDYAARESVENPSLDAPRASRFRVPFSAPPGLMNSLTVRTFNEVWFRHAPAQRSAQSRSLSSFFHPLDGIREWNLVWGKRGFVQYQFVVPDDAADVVERAVQRLSSSHVPSFFAVLKRFGPANAGLLSFPREGWTLALDMPVGPAALPKVLDDLDEMVIGANGRVYLAKDSRLDATSAAAMYPHLDALRQIKKSIDPESLLTSDLARRLGLSER